jgi:hypothetical protein
MWRNTGRTFAETLQLDRIFSNCSRIEMTGHGALEQCLREPGANVGVTLHMGNWEIVSIAVGLCGARTAGVYRALRNPYLDRYVRLMREPFYFPPTGDIYFGARRIRPRRRRPDLDRALLAHRSPFAFPRRDQGIAGRKDVRSDG